MNFLEAVIPISAILVLFLGLPWLLLHYMTKWKQAGSLTVEDENLLDELHDIARSLDSRMHTIERIIAADRDLAAGVSPISDQRAAADYSNVELHPQARNRDAKF